MVDRYAFLKKREAEDRDLKPYTREIESYEAAVGMAALARNAAAHDER